MTSEMRNARKVARFMKACGEIFPVLKLRDGTELKNVLVSGNNVGPFVVALSKGTVKQKNQKGEILRELTMHYLKPEDIACTKQVMSVDEMEALLTGKDSEADAENEKDSEAVA